MLKKSKKSRRKNINTEVYWEHKHKRLNLSFGPRKTALGSHKLLYSNIIDIMSAFDRSSILDLGAGCGPIPWLLQYRNIDFGRYVGVDFSIEGLQEAKRQVSEIEIYKTRIDEDFNVSEIKPNSFNIVVCCEVWEHLTNFIPAAKNTYKYLSNTGIGITTVPYGKMMCKSHYHINIPRNRIIEAHKQANLSIIEEKVVARWLIVKSKRSK